MILCIETSSDVCSVALCRGADVVAHKEVYENNAHAASLTPMIEEMMAEVAVDFSSLKAVALSAGPGSYTGLRIGASTAKGICYALGIPLISIPTLDLIAKAMQEKVSANYDYVAPMIDARRMEVYMQVVDAQGNTHTETSPVIIDETSLQEYLSAGKKVLVGGNGAEKCKNVIASENALFVDGVYPLALNMGAMAEAKLQQNRTESVAYYEPFYLKEFQTTTPKNKVLGV